MKKKYDKNILIGILTLFLFSSSMIGCIHVNFDHSPSDKKLDLILDKSFPSKDGAKLNVSTSSGDVKLVSWENKEVQVKIYGNAKAKEKLEYYVEANGNDVDVKIKRKGSLFNVLSNVSLKVEINLPTNFNTDISTSGGDIDVLKLTGNSEFSTSGGDIRLLDLNGNVNSSTSGGDIKVSNFYGRLDASTSGGDVKVMKAVGDIELSTSGGDITLSASDGKVNASTSGGDIQAEYFGMNKGINLSTSGGNISVLVDKDFKADVNLSTLGGDVSCSLPTTYTEKKSSSIIGKINGGGSLLECSTLGGDIRVKSR